MTGRTTIGAWAIENVPWEDERAVALRAAMDEEISPRYAEVYAAFDDETRALLAEDFAVDPVTMVEVILVRDAEGVAVGHAALRQLGDELEVKRVFVDPRARGRGASQALMSELERLGRERGAARLILQTGNRQPEAIALYVRLGYRPIDIYPPYLRFPASRCFEKVLTD
ncbi:MULTISPECIES: GNAT family N-acetyltransferase [Microbacterium]|uniref:GNAT family N-acetyltransferase n=1 Tax=Microbacterium TaxID=33882 RepID=UPI002274C44A|nr:MULTISPECIES: GNAT family N-acetyltransferase [Microbacterium]MCY1715983.1 GNAT family N-acetyltransferase [Microbacterium sp. SL62]MDZ5144913.1 GNAT family N-acetyltransferase [Microbacterium testaceum]